MKLRKATRKRIYEAAAKRESLTIAWPASAPEPLPGHKYPVKGFDSETRLEVQARTEVSDQRWKATVKLDSDPIRGLRVKARRGVEAQPLGGPQFRAETEPEQVDSRYQRLLDEEGRLKTVMAGAFHRQHDAGLAKEYEIAEGRPRKGRSERAKVRHLRSIEERKTA
jgi:hypothetical protein